MKALRFVFNLLLLMPIAACSYASPKIAFDKLGSGKLVNRLKSNTNWDCNLPEIVSKPYGVKDCVGLKDDELFSIYKDNIYYENMGIINNKLMKIFGGQTSSIESFIEKGKLYGFDCNRQGITALCKYHGEFGINMVQGPFSIFKPPFGGKYIFDFLVKRNVQKETEIETSGFIYPIDGENSGIIKLY